MSELEVYCENLYQMTLVLEKPNQAKELAGVLAKELLQIRRLIEREVPERTEAIS